MNKITTSKISKPTAIITKLLTTALKELKLPNTEINLEHPVSEKFGDYSCNVALKISHEENPRELAAKIVSRIKKIIDADKSSFISDVSVAGPGFINFHLKQEWFLGQVQAVITKGKEFGVNKNLKGKKVSIEYTDPNPFKEFHIGHLYSNIVGESISKLHEASGAQVWRGDFFGDVGMHVAKSIWGLLQKFKEDGADVSDLKKKPLKIRIEYFGQAYAKGATAYKEDEQAKEEMKLLNFLIFKAAQEIILPTYNKRPEVDYDRFIKKSKYDYDEIKALYKIGREWSLDYFETIYKRLGTKFDGYYPESLTGEYGYGMVLDGLEKGIFEKGEGGAIIFPGKKHDLHNRVFINSLGLPTYETKDFGLAVAKYKNFEYDMSFNITGNEIDEYFKVVLKALRMLNPKLGNATVHIGHGMVRLPEGKMSSRTGKILRGEWLLDEAQKRALQVIEQAASIPKNDQAELSEQVAQAAVKYALLKQSIGNNVSFDFKSSVSFDGNSGPYIQYTYARARSIWRKLDEQEADKVGLDTNFSNLDFEKLVLSEEELSILRWLYRFPEVVQEAALSYAPHLICSYLFELAQRFNTFYNKHSVLQARSQDSKKFRLALTRATAQVLKNGLGLLNISAPEKM